MKLHGKKFIHAECRYITLEYIIREFYQPPDTDSPLAIKTTEKICYLHVRKFGWKGTCITLLHYFQNFCSDYTHSIHVILHFTTNNWNRYYNVTTNQSSHNIVLTVCLSVWNYWQNWSRKVLNVPCTIANHWACSGQN